MTKQYFRFEVVTVSVIEGYGGTAQDAFANAQNELRSDETITSSRLVGYGIGAHEVEVDPKDQANWETLEIQPYPYPVK